MPGGNFCFCESGEYEHFFEKSGDYLLVDEKLIVALDAQFSLGVPKRQALFKHHAIDFQAFFAQLFSPLNHKQHGSGGLQFQTEFAQFFGTLSIPIPRLSDLAQFTPPEAHIRIRIIGLLTGLELQPGSQSTVARGRPPRLPVFVEIRGKAADEGGNGIIDLFLQFFQR